MSSPSKLSKHVVDFLGPWGFLSGCRKKEKERKQKRVTPSLELTFSSPSLGFRAGFGLFWLDGGAAVGPHLGLEVVDALLQLVYSGPHLVECKGEGSRRSRSRR